MTDVHTVSLEARAWDGRIVQRGIDIIKNYEGWPKSWKSYVCPVGLWTNGHGALRGLDGKRVTKNSLALTKKQGEVLFPGPGYDRESRSRSVGPCLTPDQFSACVSLISNIGSGNFHASQIRQWLYVR